MCRNCESVCPSGVPFGRIMEAGRAQLYAQTRAFRSGIELFRRLAFQELLPHRSPIACVVRDVAAVPAHGLTASGSRESNPEWTVANKRRALLPTLPKPFLPHVEVFPAEGRVRYRVGMFTGCIMPLTHGPVHAATLRVLRRNGCEVHIPRQQVCCGALNVHAGERDTMRDLARRNLRAFLGRGLDAIIVNSAGCGSTMKEYGEILDAARGSGIRPSDARRDRVSGFDRARAADTVGSTVR